MKALIHSASGRIALFIFTLASPLSAQPPSILWTTNVGGRVFATDTQTNVYSQAGGTVIKIGPDGTPLQTNVLSIFPGVALRDGDGNFYYAGLYPGTANGSLICYYPGNTAFFLAKFDAAGSFQWSQPFGYTGCLKSIGLWDLQFDLNGNLYAGWGLPGYLIFRIQ